GCIFHHVTDRSGTYQDTRRQLDEFELHQIGFALQVGAALNRHDSVCPDFGIDADSVLDVNESNSITFEPKRYRAPRSRGQCHFDFPFGAIKFLPSMVNAVARYSDVTESLDDLAVELEHRRDTKHGTACDARGLHNPHRYR